MAMLSVDAVRDMGFKSVGHNVLVSNLASFYGIQQISLGDNVRIDDFCVLSAGAGGITIGNHVHLAINVSLIGAGKITLCDYVGISSRVAIYSSSDDYSGAAMIGPQVPSEFRNVHNADVYLGKHVIVGSGSVILPGLRLEEGAAIGALSLVRKDCESFGIYAGIPARKIRDRKRDLLALENELVLSKQPLNKQHFY